MYAECGNTIITTIACAVIEQQQVTGVVQLPGGDVRADNKKIMFIFMSQIN